MTAHVIVGDLISSFKLNDYTRSFWTTLIPEPKYGWHTIEKNNISIILKKFKEFIDELISMDAPNGLKREIQYGDKIVYLSPVSEAQTEAMFLILTYNSIIRSSESENLNLLLVPDYDSLHEEVFVHLKHHKTISLDRLTDRFGDKAVSVIDDFRQIGLINIVANEVCLSGLTTEISFLNESKGSATKGGSPLYEI